MITIMLAHRPSESGYLGEMLKSLRANASSPDAYEALIKLDDDLPLPELPDYVKYVVSPRRRGYADLHLAYKELLPLADKNSRAFWVLSDDVLVLGGGWDKYIEYYIDKFDVLCPTFMSALRDARDSIENCENYPVWSRKWIEQYGFGDTFSTDGYTGYLLWELAQKGIEVRRSLPVLRLIRRHHANDDADSERSRTVRAEAIERILNGNK